jgi:acetolactate synthase-1/2/3 large subunit
MNGAESLLSTARAAGIEVCFANFGTSEMHLVTALDAVPGIRPVPALFEGVCTGAADGYGRMLGKPAMVLLHLGLGLANGLANLHNAKRARTPVFTVVGEHATWHQASDSPESADIQALAAPVSGWVRYCESAAMVSRDTTDAVQAALKGQGAVLIVPQDAQWSECDSSLVPLVRFGWDPMDEARVREATDLLRKGAGTLLLLGGRALSRRGLLAAAAIKKATGCGMLVETFLGRMERGLGLPLVGRVPYFPEQALAQLSGYQSVVLAGAREPVATFAYKDGKSSFIRDDQLLAGLADPNQDVEEILEYVADMVTRSETGDYPVAFPEASKRPTTCTGLLTADTAGRTLAALQPEGTILVDEAVTSGGPYYAYSQAAPEHTVLSVTGGAIGQGMPCSVGAAIACPDRPVINLQADGSAMYTLQSLWTQAREGLNVTTLLCANRSYAILQIEMARGGYLPMGEAAKALTDLGAPPIDWVELSRGMGVPGVSVTSAEDLATELRKALEEPGPHLIEMLLHPAESVRVT